MIGDHYETIEGYAIFMTVRSSSLVSGFFTTPCQMPARSWANKPLAGRIASAIRRFLNGFLGNFLPIQFPIATVYQKALRVVLV